MSLLLVGMMAKKVTGQFAIMSSAPTGSVRARATALANKGSGGYRPASHEGGGRGCGV